MNTPRSSSLSSGMVMLLAAAAGIIVANLYYAQTLVGPIGAALGLSPAAAGLIVTLTQIGYTLGLLFIVPLGDLLENRRLIVTGLLVTSGALVVAATRHHRVGVPARRAGHRPGRRRGPGIGAICRPPVAGSHTRPGGRQGRQRPAARHHGGAAGGKRAGRPGWLADRVRHRRCAGRPAGRAAAYQVAAAAADGGTTLSSPDRLAVAAVDHDRGAASARAVSRRPVRRLQPVLDRGATGAGRPGVRPARRTASPSLRWSAWPAPWPRLSPAAWPTPATR